MKRSYDSPARAAMKRLCRFLGLVLVVMLCATLYTRQLLMQGNYNHIRDIPSFSLELPKLDLQGFLANVQNLKLGGEDSDVVNILLVGQDAQEGEETARSDSMILCTYNKESHRLTMTSFLRDLYVPIPGHGSNRINAAYALGGISLLEETLESNFDLQIDGGIEVDFSQFSEIIDLLGGVELELRQDEADYINKKTGGTLTEGVQLLNGEQALAYSRIRKLDSDGDFSRTNRQRKVLSALMDVYKSSSLTTMLGLVDDLYPLISTNMSRGKLLMLVLELLPNLSDAQIVSQSVPAEGSYTDKTIDGMAVLVADTEAVREMLKQTLSE